MVFAPDFIADPDCNNTPPIRNGSSFSDGALAGAEGEIVAINTEGMSLGGRYLATVGSAGIVAELTGGDFADGVVISSLGFFLNEMSSRNAQKSVDSTLEAVDHYYNGSGEPVELGPNTQAALRNHPEQIRRFENIRSGSASTGNYGVDLTFSPGTFHVGDTTVQYSTMCGVASCRTTFTGFTRNIGNGGYSPDGFWDANIFTPWGHDRMGPGSEFQGGTVYLYTPYTWTRDWP